MVILITTVIATLAYFLCKEQRERLKLRYLVLMLLGMLLMVFVDHLIAAIEGEPFISYATDGLVKSSTLLGLLMILPVFMIWFVLVLKPYVERQHF